MDSITLMNIYKYIQYMYNNLFLNSYVACMCDKNLHLNTEQSR